MRHRKNRKLKLWLATLGLLTLLLASTVGCAAPQQEAQSIELTLLCGEETYTLELEAYILGVVLGEMPASFEMDALRAQAVAARTYTLRACVQGSKHGSNTICTDATCCQAYISAQDYLTMGGTEDAVQRVRQAVTDTAGQVLVYEGELIFATYFSCAGDSTEDAVAVWGQSFPYLQAVPSPGEEDTVFYADSKAFTPEQLQSALGITLSGDSESWFGEVTYTAGGGVDTLQIGGVSFSGTELRQALELRSTAFTVSVEEDQIVFSTKGFGHRVGMSQYGANAMAKTGATYEQILQYYYSGAEIVQYGDE